MTFTLEKIRDEDLVFTKSDLCEQPALVKQIQARLSVCDFYPETMLDGVWGPKTEQAIMEFCEDHHLNNGQTGIYGRTFAKFLLETEADKPDISYLTVAKILGVPAVNVQKHLPALIKALKQEGIYSKRTLLALLATIGTEVPKFEPIREIGGRAYFISMYAHRRDLGNRGPDDAVNYCGKGWIQLTGRYNYLYYGGKIGIDLEAYPERALESKPAAQILACYFNDRNVHRAADAGNWRAVRKKVNGGYNGWDRFSELVTALLPHLA